MIRFITNLLAITTTIILVIVVLLIATFYIYKLPAGKNATLFNNIVLCHKANNSKYTGNTLSAIKQAVIEGCTAIELDVSQTKDNQLVVIHDMDFNKFTQKKGKVSDYSFSQLQKFNVSDKGKTDEKIVTISDALQLARKLNLKVEFDVKPSTTNPEAIKQLLKLFNKDKIYDDVLISSFNPYIIYKIRAVNPDILTSLGIFKFPFPKHPILSKIFINSEMTWLPHFLGISLIEPHMSLVSLDFTRHWKRYKIYTNVFTVNNKVDKDWFRYHKITYQTDCIKSTCLNKDYSPWANLSYIQIFKIIF